VSRLFRATNQLDRKINPSQANAINRRAVFSFTGIERPKPLFKSKDFWVQGLSVGFNVLF
jgi:hypothetical protein